MIIETIRLEDLHESPFNPRVKLTPDSKEYKSIAASIREFGMVEPLVVNRHNMNVIGGHQRLRVLRDGGVEETECVMIDESDPLKEKALCVALNKIKGDWDMDKLAELLSDDEVSVFPTGFEEGEVDLSKYLDTDPEDIPVEDPEESTDDPEEDEGSESTTVIKIGTFKFTVTATEYQELLNSIRDSGIFDAEGMQAEMVRRILND